MRSARRVGVAIVLMSVAVVVLASPVRVAAGESPSESVVAISNHPQLFLDDHVVAQMKNLQRVVQRPRKHPANPLIVQEFPWERRTVQVYGTVLYEPESGKFRCWYLGSENPDAKPEYYMCYAESSDGIRWTKPMVGSGRIGRHDRHNVVVPGGHGLCVLRSPTDPNPKRRYKGLGGDTLAFSPDGVRWTLEPFEAAGKNDTGSSVVFWRGEYLAYVRNQERDPDWPAVMRGVALSTSRDFRRWTPKKTILTTDKRDGYPWVQPYGMEVSVYGDQLIGLLPVLFLERIKGNNSLGVIRVQLAVSRDGRRWHRVADRATLLAPTPAGSKPAWDSGTIFPSTTLLVKDDEIRIYYTGVTRRHGAGRGAPRGIGLATLPADRFVALMPRSPSAKGILHTKRFSASGKDLRVNADVTADDLQVELLDAKGRVLEGFGRDRCRLVRCDELRYRATWRDGARTRTWADAPKDRSVSLRFILGEGKLYAFQVGD